jgi:transposase
MILITHVHAGCTSSGVQKHYPEVMDRLREWIMRFRMEITDDWILHHDNELAHTALPVRKYLVKKCMPLLPEAPYSPDFSPCEFYLFPKLKSRVSGYHFQTHDSVQKAVTDAIKNLTEADFQSCYEVWKILWAKYVASEVSYSEGTMLI